MLSAVRGKAARWRQIHWVANALTIQGGLEIVLGLALALGAADSDTRVATTAFEILLARVAPWTLILGGSLKAFAARRNRKYRGRRVGLAALWSAVPLALGCVCAPTGLALLIYGSLVYADPIAREAFALGESGMPPDEIEATLRSRAQPVA